MYNILIAGSTDFTVVCIKEALQNININLAGIIAPEDVKKDRSGKIILSPVSEFAKEKCIPLFRPNNINDIQFIEKIKELNIDLFIVVAYGQILSEAALNIANIQSVNIHASLLPTFRGASPIEAALLHGFTQTGVTLQKMNIRLDEGDVLLQKAIKIKSDSAYQELYEDVKIAGSALLGQFLNDVEGSIEKAQVQDKRNATYCKKIKKTEAKLDFSKKARDLNNQIRAYSLWPVSYFNYNDIIIRVYKARVKDGLKSENNKYGEIIEINNEGIYIQTSNGVLIITELQKSGKKRQNVKDFINGTNIKVGDYIS